MTVFCTFVVDFEDAQALQMRKEEALSPIIRFVIIYQYYEKLL